MSGRSFRFLQASDFHLDQPPYGLAEIPDHLVELLAEAPYRAAARVFDLAIAEKVDFVVLAGNLVEPNQAGPRGLTFLHEQFTRLAEHRIPVYWTASASDSRELWPPVIRWPANLHVFSSSSVERIIHSRDGQPLCRLAGFSASHRNADPAELLDEFGSAADQLFTIGILPNLIDAVLLADLPVSFWALGGAANASTPLSLTTPPRIAHAAGSPQGRSPGEFGPHGCTLVCVDDASRVRLLSHAADAVRWHHERMTVEPDVNHADLDHLVRERLELSLAAMPDRPLLIHWTIAGAGRLVQHARRTGLAASLAEGLRRDFGYRTPAAWTATIEFECPELPATVYEQQSLLGDFLRAARARESSPQPLDLTTYISERQAAGDLAASAVIAEPAARRKLLREAGLLGHDLLNPEPLLAKE